MADYLKFVLFLLSYFISVIYCQFSNLINDSVVIKQSFMFWPGAIVPFYIDKEHFDTDQQNLIKTTLQNFEFKTCLKFALVPEPDVSLHLLLLENPTGIRQCTINTDGHSIDEAHRVTLGYDCLNSPDIDMMIMRALGFSFEHNRASRDVYIDVQHENIIPAYLELFTRDFKLPLELRSLPYDIHSVMHFGERHFSKNGHRTIVFKDKDTKQNRVGLTTTDSRKIEMVYGPECLKRDRQEKVDLCQRYPGVVRRKRDVEYDTTRSLRVNRDITAPAQDLNTTDVSNSIKELDIAEEVQDIVDRVHKISALALKNARYKYCNNTKPNLRSVSDVKESNSSDILGIVEAVAAYAKTMVDHALANLTEFCETSESIDMYQRSRCPFYDPVSRRCPQGPHKSTKVGAPFRSTHMKVVDHYTRHGHTPPHGRYMPWRSGNAPEEPEQDNEKDENKTITNKESEPTTVENRQTEPITPDPRIDVHENVPNNDTNNILRMVTTVDLSRHMPNYRAQNDTRLNGTAKRRRKRHFTSESTARRKVEVKIELRNDSAIKEVKEVENSSKSDNNTKVTPSVESSASGRRFFQGRQFKVKNAKGSYFGTKGKVWEESEGSLETPELKKRPAEAYQEERPKKFKPKRNKDRSDRLEDWPELKSKKSRKPAPLEEDEEERTMLKPKKPRKPAPLEEDEEERTVLKSKKIWKSVPAEEEHGAVVKPKRTRNPADEEETSNTIREPGAKPVHEDDDKEDEEVADRLKKEVKEKKIVSGAIPQAVQLSRQNKEFYRERRWPKGHVPYLIKDIEGYDINDVRERIEEVNSILKEKTCVKLQEISESETNKYEDYIVLDDSQDYVTGRVGGRQNFGVLELFKGGQHRQHAAMMIMAMLGFYFEVSRHDRDKYIRVHQRHVRADKLHHFEKIREDATFPLPYDYESATHPAWQFWRQVGKTGISTVATLKYLDPDGTIMKTLGQNQKLLSDTDIVKINTLYGVKCFSSRRSRARPRRSRSRRTRTSPPQRDRVLESL